MKIQCKVIFTATEKEPRSKLANKSRHRLDIKSSIWEDLDTYPKEHYDITYHFEIRKLRKLIKKEGEDWTDLTLLHKTEPKPWLRKEGKSEYISWAEIPFSFNHDDLTISIKTDSAKI